MRQRVVLTGTRLAVLVVAGALMGSSCGSGSIEQRVVLDGLSQPRGIMADGDTVCVAVAGELPAAVATGDPSAQLEAETGRVVCRHGDDGDEVTTVVGGLPFVYYPDAAVTSGAADLALVGGRMHVLVGEASGRVARSIVTVEDGEPHIVADLLAFAEERVGADGLLRSNPFSLVPLPDEDGFLVADAATGSVLRAGLDGEVAVYAPVPGHEVLAGMAWGLDGELYVASFGQLPHPPGSGAVVAIGTDGVHRTVVDGLTMPIDVGFDGDGGMFVLEYATPQDEPTDPGDAYRDASGRLLYTESAGAASRLRVVADGLSRPTSLVVGDDIVWVSLAAGELAAAEGSVVAMARHDLLKG